MQVLALDVGTGTQDIVLFDTEQPVENSLKMVMPSPTVIVAGEIRLATLHGQPVLFQGVTMGGGPCAWAAEDHIRAGYRFYATPAAARTFNDDLEEVARMGVTIVPEGETGIEGVKRVRSGDLQLEAILDALRVFRVEPHLEALGVAVFDHGAAPPGVSDRLFRFEYLKQVIESDDLTGFAHPSAAIPPHLTRMAAVAHSVSIPVRVLLMDTGPAAILGTLEDERVRQARSVLSVNIGNFHTLAFHLVNGRVAGLFEHHTGMLTRDKLEDYLLRLSSGRIDHEEVFADSGHGALLLTAKRTDPEVVAVTGPRRGLLRGSKLAPHFAVPHGDMMIAGCFGLLRAMASKMPELGPAIRAGLG